MSGDGRATWDVTWERCPDCPAPLIEGEVHRHMPTPPPPPPADDPYWQATRGRPPNPGRGAIPPGGRFIERAEGKAAHQCPLPQEWREGALWQCPDGHLWVVRHACECQGGEHHRGNIHTMGLAWWPASWLQRRRFGPGMKRADLAMAGRNVREQLGVKRTSAKHPSGLDSPPADYDG